MAQEIKKALCFWCKGRCKVNVLVEDDHLIGVEPDPDYPMKILPPTKACVRRMAAKEFFYHQERVNYPLKRAGEKGENKWQQVSWDTALDEIAARLELIRGEYGAEAVARSSGTGRTNMEFATRFFNLFGSPNDVGQATICYGPRAAISPMICGWFPFSYASTEIKAANVVLWGRSPDQSWPRPWYLANEAKKQGGKVIAVDPRSTPSAALADIHLQLRPGTDCALALGMLHLIINEELYDKDFVDKWCYGFDQLKQRVQEYPLGKVAQITNLPEDKIRDAARMYASTKPWTIIDGMGVEQLENNAEYLHARYILSAITGNLGADGGDVIPGPHPKLIMEQELELHDALPKEQKLKQLGADRFKIFTWPGYDMIQENVRRVWGKNSGNIQDSCQAPAPLLYRAIITGQPYPVKALITLASNPMVTQGNTKLVYEALKKLDLYVVVDFWMTPSTQLADYVLPAACWLERPVLWTGFGTHHSVLGGERSLPSTISGEYDHKTDYQFWRGLGLRLGQEGYWPWQTMEEVFDYRLKPMGYTFQQFMEKGGRDFPPVDYKVHEQRGFGTPTGKIELYSTILEKLGYDPLPYYQEPSETPLSQPELAKEYPFVLITGGRHRPFFHSEFRQIDSLRRRHPDPLVQIHPETAKRIGIADGEWVWIETPRGRVRQRCQYFDGMDSGIVHAQHGWWFPELPGEEPWLHGVWESNINVCTADDPERLNTKLGSWPLRTFLCKVYKAKMYE